MTAGWNYADTWEAVADRFGDEQALVHGDLVRTWRELDERADGIAQALLDAGLGRQAKVAQYQRNSPAYLEVLYGCFKASLVPVNTNYRYGDDELRYLWTNSDAEAVVFDAEFTDVADRLHAELPSVRVWLRVGDDAACPPWARPYEAAATSHPGRVRPAWDRSGDDLYLLYTGGTTGQPKGVMWRQDDLFRMLEVAQGSQLPEPPDAARFVAALDRPGVTSLPAAPLMHGTACWFVMPILSRGGSVVTLTDPSLDPVELLDTVVARRVKGLCIVGEAFARPLLAALDAEPERWDLSGLRVLFSSGAILGEESKRRFLRHAPNAMVVDGLGSSESGSLGRSITSGDDAARTASFRLSADARVIDDDGRDVVPGSGQKGRLAIGGHIPLGYYGDPEKTAATFVELAGRRYVVAGDWAEVAEDGTITLLGRGSSCINTAGEKVFPEEVEEVLKAFPRVQDAGVVGVPDERFGEAVTAIVQLEPGAELDEAALIGHVKAHLAHYKAPKRVFVAPSFPRGPNGKIDHKLLKAQALEALGSD
ncbi:MAG TPA: AMP-binding protein [Acidimicrobiales bacterium]|jgi:fatty-acyl-CoA synthase|nr:AMP-binding protein [Acidimicrobiales bacterium]